MDISLTRIVVDSSADLKNMEGIDFKSAPLKIITAQKEYTDDSNLDVAGMVNDLAEYSGRSSTSCPNAEDWLEAFGDAQNVFCITITATLSGSYNAALIAKDIYEERYPGRRVFVLNSLTTGPEMVLMAEKIRELVTAGNEFDEVCESVTSYTQNTGLLFVLSSMKNLANNGRVSPLVAKMAGLLGIRVVGKASSKGDLETLSKCRGEKHALGTVVRYLQEMGLNNGRVRITHCLNPDAAASLAALIREQLPASRTEIDTCGGLCSFYAEKGGLLIGFEKF